jgi:hypothetical protein
MWVPSKVADWFKISKDLVDDMRVEVATLRVERDSAKAELATTKANFSWLVGRVNDLEAERAVLLREVHGISKPIPEIIRPSRLPMEFASDLFEDMGEDKAKTLGLPTYSADN